MKSKRRVEKEVAATARKTFGYDSLRPGQQEAIDSILAGRDTIAILPKGAGKSAIYQIPAVMLDGPTVVISPLIALQKDQVDALQEHDAGGAAVVNSQTRAREKRSRSGIWKQANWSLSFLRRNNLPSPKCLRAFRKPSRRFL